MQFFCNSYSFYVSKLAIEYRHTTTDCNTHQICSHTFVVLNCYLRSCETDFCCRAFTFTWGAPLSYLLLTIE